MRIICNSKAVEFSTLKSGDCFYPSENSRVLYMKMPLFDEKHLGPINAVNLVAMGYTKFDDDHHVFPIEAEIHTAY